MTDEKNEFEEIMKKLRDAIEGDTPADVWVRKLQRVEAGDEGRKMSVLVEIPADMPRMALEGPIPDNTERRGIVFPGLDYSCAGVMYGEYKIHVSARREDGGLQAEVFRGTELVHNIVVSGTGEESKHAGFVRKLHEKTLRWLRYQKAFLGIVVATGIANVALAIVFGHAFSWFSGGWVGGFLTFVTLNWLVKKAKEWRSTS